ncbi:helix-turn-helix domain-containing protein, partial [Klebsiella pneumoniae]|uniref:helix-turn-helix domain-containing protein n=1 Tax=Klebsiella pneumoniae TaxID=573 RepID=UPI0013C36D88
NNNLTQKQFAQMFKVSESAIGIYERDEREPPYKLSNEVDDHYEVTTDYLHGHTDNPNPIKQGKIDEKEQAQFKAFIN